MKKMKKGDRLVCEPCGRELTVDACGVSEEVLWCCGKPMGSKSRKKTVSRKKK